MKKTIRTGGFFAKAEGEPKGWRERLAALRGKGKTPPKSTAKLEIDDANGETLIFPEIGDVSEIAEGVAVTATDGDHVFVSDDTTYTVTVAAGAITAVVTAPVDEEGDAMSAETVEFIEAVAHELGENETFRASARLEIDALTADNVRLKADFEALKATLGHKKPAEGEGTEKPLMVGGKKIDLTKINLK